MADAAGHPESGNDQLETKITVEADASQAYRIFVEEFGAWWPKDYTFAQERLEAIGVEGRPGGRCFERDVEGAEQVWGTVTEAQGPERLVFLWQITPSRSIESDADKASEVEVRFVPAGAGRTDVHLVHRRFARHGAGWETYRDTMASDYGWTLCLERFANTVKA